MGVFISHTTFVIERDLPGSPVHAFRFWSEHARKRQWTSCHPDWTVLEDVLDVRVGGRYRISFNSGDGNYNEVGGVYREVVPNERLVFSWAWHSTPERESLVTVSIKPDGAGTLLTFRHEQFADETARDNHQRGWTEFFVNLENYVAA